MKTSSKSQKGSQSGKSKGTESNKIHELFENQLRDLYWAEKELSRFMPELVKNVTSEELISTLEEHMEITEKQIKRLENVFELIGSRATGEKCPAMTGLIEEAQSVVSESTEGQIRDAFIIGAVQKVEHYEMASYGTLKAIASLLGEFEVASLLDETLQEEKEADLNLTDVAENVVNIEASMEAGELEEEEDEEFEELTEEEDDEELQGMSRSKSKSKSKSKGY